MMPHDKSIYKTKWLRQLTIQQHDSLRLQDCYYCLIPYSTIEGNGIYRYNGIDRLDSSKDYTIDNCVSCCKTCNLGKGNKTPQYWQEHIERMRAYYSKNHKKIKRELKKRGFDV